MAWRARVLGWLICSLPAGALAWGHAGHQLVGSLADELLAGSNAAKMVATILGPQIGDLQRAATWLDCVRDVERLPSGAFRYTVPSSVPSAAQSGPQPRACAPFASSAEVSRMESYVRRNWSNCRGETEAAGAACHRRYHFADVAIQHAGYARGAVGTGESDIVSAIGAAIAVLQDRSPLPPTPLDIVDKKEALLLIAHLIGDLHQPLHVAAIYLTEDGTALDPDAAALARADAMPTRGGNRLEVGASNLHAVWDEIPKSMVLAFSTRGHDTARRRAWIASARRLPMTAGQVDDWPLAWASDTVVSAHRAFPPGALRFNRAGTSRPGDWVVQFADEAGYRVAREALQRQQIIKAAARLAQLMKAVWP